MFYPGEANGYPPRPFAGAPVRALRTSAGAGRASMVRDIDRCKGGAPNRRVSELPGSLHREKDDPALFASRSIPRARQAEAAGSLCGVLSRLSAAALETGMP